VKPGDVRIDAEAIKRLRKDRVLSQRELARVAEVTHARSSPEVSVISSKLDSLSTAP
jgi:transcriptional regulator with XRE-family HTH domain